MAAAKKASARTPPTAPRTRRPSRRKGPTLPLSGSHHTIDSFSELVERLSLWPAGPALDQFRPYRRWAFESAALDLALRQAGKSLAEALEREPKPLRFVASMRFGDPATIAPLRAWLDLYPDLRVKLDPTGTWDDALVNELVETGAVDTLDFKGAYEGTPVDQPPDPTLYARIALAFPDAWLEDPALNDETDPVLEPHRDRITWDAPIHSVADIVGLPFPPRTLNFKPSRFGSIKRLFDALRPLRRGRHRDLRRRPVRARPRPRADPVPRLALPPGLAERHGACGLQREARARGCRRAR